MKRILRNIRAIGRSFNAHFEYFYVLDLSRFSAKLALVELDNDVKKASVLEVVQVHLEDSQAKNEYSFNRQALVSSLKQALLKIRFKTPKTYKIKLVIGLVSEDICGKKFSHLVKRDNKTLIVDLQEIKNSIHTATLKAYEDIRKNFALETGHSNTGVYILNSNMQEIKVGSHKLEDLKDIKGDEIVVTTFNSYYSNFYKALFEEVALEIGLEIKDLFYTPYVLFSVLRKAQGPDLEALLIDLGGKTTSISLIRHGQLEQVKSFSFGGGSFTSRISSTFSISRAEAEDIKLSYSQNRLSNYATQVVEEMLGRELELFLNALVLILKDFSYTHLLPQNLYILGGGGNLALINGIIRKKRWKAELSFAAPLRILTIEKDVFTNLEVASFQLLDFQIIPLLSLVDYAVYTSLSKESFADQTLKRIVRLIQD